MGFIMNIKRISVGSEKRKLPFAISAVAAAVLLAAFGSAASAAAGEKLVGGENASAVAYQGNTTPSPLSVNTTDPYDEIIGGHHVKQIKNDGASAEALVAVENAGSSVTIGNVNGVQYVVGGSKSNNSYAALTTDSSAVTINGGTIGTTGGDSAVIGGNLLKATSGQGGPVATSQLTSSLVTITGGTFTMKSGTPSIVGGSMAVDYSTNSKDVSLSVQDKKTSLVISGGDFSDAGDLVGGAVASGSGASASVAESSVKLTSGKFNGSAKQYIFGGSVALDGATASTARSSVEIDGTSGFSTEAPSNSTSQDDLQDVLYFNVFGGGKNAATTELSSVTINNAQFGFEYATSSSNSTVNKVNILSGSRFETSGTYTEGNSSISVADSIIMGDIRGGSWAGSNFSSSAAGDEYHVTAGNSTVIVKNTSMNGYTKGVSTWNGRIFGAGMLQYVQNSSYTIESTSVQASNITGLDKEQGSGDVTHDPGARIFGGGQVYSGGNDQNNTFTVKSSSVTLTGGDSQVYDVIGGSIISGTNKYSTNKVVLGSSAVHVTDAYVSNRIVGGNDVNWFGTGDVTGNTSITVDGTADVNAVIGASTATFFGGYVFGDGVRTATMTGNASITIDGSAKSSLVIGAGYAESASEGGSPSVGDGTQSSKTADGYNSAASSTLSGNTSITVKGDASVDVLVGAGYAWSDSAFLIDGSSEQINIADGKMTGTASVTVEGGTVSELYLGGLGQGYGKAEIEGDADGSMTGGSVSTVVVGGVGEEKAVFNYNYTASEDKATVAANNTAYGTATVSGNSNFTATGGTLGRVILGGAVKNSSGEIVLADDATDDQVMVNGTASLILAGDVDLTKASVEAGAAGKTLLQFGTDEVAWSGSFTNFTNIDELAVAAGSELTLEHLTVDQMAAEGMTLSGAGLITVDTIDHASKTLTLVGGTLAATTIAMTGTGALVVNGGTLQTTTDQIFTASLGADGTVLSAKALKENGVTYTSGTVFFTDSLYNVHYASDAAALLGDHMDVAFTGTLISADSTDESENTLTVDDYEGNDIAENVIFANASLDAAEENKNLTIGKAVAETDAVIDQSVGVKSIALGDKTEVVTVNDNKVLTLIGGGGDVLSGGNNAEIVVGSESKGSGTLRLGVAGVESSGGNINADLTILDGSSVLVADGAAFTFEKKLENNGYLRVDGRVEASLTGTGDVEVGSDNTAGEIVLKGETMGSNTIFLDPAWKESGGDVITDASKLFWDTDKVDGTIIAGQNSWFALGTEDASEFLTIFGNSGLSWGADGVTAAAYVAKPVSLNNAGSLIVDGSLTEMPQTAYAVGTVIFGANSLLVADVSSLASGHALISGANGNASVDSTSKIILSGVASGGKYLIIDDADAQWAPENVASANAMYGDAQVDAETGEISFDLQSADTVYGSLMQGGSLADAAMADSAAAAYAYADKLLTQIDGNLAAAAARFDAAMNPGGALAVFTTAYDRSIELRDAVRADKAQVDEKGLWVQVTGGKTKLKGISTGAQDLHTKTDVYGIIIGGEHDFGGKTAGIAFSAGTGDTKNHAVDAKDDFNYYGFSLYGSMQAGAFEILGDVSATWLKSDLSVGGVADVDTDTTTTVWSAGVQLRRPLDAGYLVVTPFVGADLYHVRADGYDNGYGANVADESATLVEFPIGVELSKAFKTNGMSVEPVFSFALVPTAGDREMDQTVAFAGAMANYNFTFADDFKARSRLGVNLKADAFRFGLSAGYDWGNEERSSANVLLRASYLF